MNQTETGTNKSVFYMITGVIFIAIIIFLIGNKSPVEEKAPSNPNAIPC
jgi:hypothetical protein